MFARTNDQARRNDAGFTLIELIVVMVIIGILAAVALPVYQNQQRQAADTATKSDLTSISRMVASVFVDNPTSAASMSLVASGSGVQVKVGTAAIETIQLSPNVTLVSGAKGSHPSYNFPDQYNWCVALTNPQGKIKTLRYQNGSGISAGSC